MEEHHPPAPERCALEKDKTDCVCTGTVFYGREKDPWDKEETLDFEKMKEYKFVTKKAEGAIGCNSLEFGDPI